MLKPVYNKSIVTVSKSDSIYTAAKKMRDAHVGTVVVVDNQGKSKKPVGILTDRDIVVELVAENIKLDSVSVGDIMTPNPVIARKDADVFEWITLMRVNGVKRLPVVDKKGKLVGLISSEDLLQVVQLELNGLAKLGKRRQHIEREVRNARN